MTTAEEIRAPGVVPAASARAADARRRGPGRRPGRRLEALYRGHVGDLTLAQLRTPAYVPIWNVEHNRAKKRAVPRAVGH